MSKIIKYKPLKPVAGSLATGSLAEFVALSVAHRTGMLRQYKDEIGDPETYIENTSYYRKMTEALPHIKRHSYDTSLLRLVHATESLDTEDIIGQLSHVSFHFDKFWIEGPVPRNIYRGSSYENIRIGALITANQATHEFSFEYVTEYNDNSEAAFNKARHLQYFQDGKILSTMTVTTRVSMDGIHMDDSKIIGVMDHVKKVYAGKKGFGDPTDIIDMIYGTADFFTRALLVLSSPNAPNNFLAKKTSEEVKLEAKNRTRKGLGFAPILSVTPIEIDLAQVNDALLESKTPKEVRQLLGWTSVRRSREVRRPDGTLWLRKKDGKPWTRKPHERQIAAPVDRRNAEREIFSSDQNLGIVIEDGRPAKVRHNKPSSDEPKHS